jgi:hypothetical protein
MFAQIPRRYALFALLALSMAVTRVNHAGTAWLPPDASWAVFYLAGYYLAREWRWAFTLLLIEALAIDGLSIRYFGLSNYCATLAYWFVLPAYSMLWLGGAWLRRHDSQVAPDVARLCASLLLSVTLCYLLTNASYYWLGSGIEHPDLAGWWSNFTRWYARFLMVPCMYVGFAALLHVAFTHRSRSAASQHAY